MVEIEDRFEVGRLVVSFDEQPPLRARRIDLPSEWQVSSGVSLLQVKERPSWARSVDGTVDAEAGVKINLLAGRAWAILVGAQPCALALDAPFISVVSHPQYSSGDYSSHDVR